MGKLSEQFFLQGGGKKLRFQEFTASGTFTPSAKLLENGGECYALAIGGGASGTALRVTGSTPLGGSIGGDAGEHIEAFVKVTGAVTVTIGAGGAAVSTTGTTNLHAANTAGGDTTFGSLLTAKGGKAYTGSFSATPTVGNAGFGGRGAGGLGGFSTDTTNTLDARGGIGIDGKAGGGAGSCNLSYGEAHMCATDGGGNGANAFGVNVTASSATANTGAGGGGASVASAGTTFHATSGAGGSGYLLVAWFE